MPTSRQRATGFNRMFFTGGSSSSTSNRRDVSGQPTATEGSSVQQANLGQRSQASGAGGISAGERANIGGITTGNNANVGGYTLGNVAAGAHVTITNDNGATQAAYQSAQSAIERIVRGQADTTAATVATLGNLAEGRSVVASDKPEQGQWIRKTLLFVLAGVALVAVGYFLKRRA